MDIQVRSEWDRVFIVAGSTEIKMPYAQAFKIAQGARLAAKHAMRMVREDVSKWRGYAEVRDLIPAVSLAPSPRRTIGGKFEWKIDVKDWDERVYLLFGNVEIVLHFEKALQLSTDLRLHARYAKSWAGDGGKSISAMGTLLDAETIYKYGWT